MYSELLWFNNQTISCHFLSFSTCHNSEQHLDSITCSIEISMSVNGFSIFHVSKQNVAGQSITGDHEKHQHNDKETFVDRHDDSLDKHRKR